MPWYYCTGAKYNVNPPQGRIGSVQTNPPYINAFGAKYATCSPCAAADGASSGDGWKACNGWNSVVTVWRQNTSNTTQSDPVPSGGMGHGYHWH